MATAAESARSRDAAETTADTLYARAVALVAIAYLAGEEPESDKDGSPLLLAATALALRLIRSAPSRYGTDLPARTPRRPAAERAAELAPRIAADAVKHAREHLTTVGQRVKRGNPDATEADIVKEFRDDTPWQRAVARTIATRLAAETALDMVADVDELSGEAHRVLWISRGDTKVRRTHRRLHGKTRAPGKSFKVWPSGQKLGFPGDPRAPLDETINCRCSLLLVPESQAWKAHDVFRVSDEDFDLTASAWPQLSQAELDFMEELTR